MHSKKPPKLLPMTDEEDAAITAAALSDPDNPPLTDEQLALMRPMREVMPDLVQELIRWQRGRPKKNAPRVSISLRLDPDLVEAMRGSGPGWQAQVNTELRRVFGLT